MYLINREVLNIDNSETYKIRRELDGRLVAMKLDNYLGKLSLNERDRLKDVHEEQESRSFLLNPFEIAENLKTEGKDIEIID